VSWALTHLQAETRQTGSWWSWATFLAMFEHELEVFAIAGRPGHDESGPLRLQSTG